ncbi:thioredoxin 1 [Desulfocicer vacuolatum DSM 3385]|uniref:Thioredoxin 1 n=1 Tax=Desulfocicer vacuolatum DSM 3385 TaxID=1121400 RepID=A0A1W2DPL3_9BACT|nr:thioredoxin family protein [Desulfocicer vacuolatum]SMC99465.1 thioredoxin 1 [Desulfocicer vacuolatum DSM 3385]
MIKELTDTEFESVVADGLNIVLFYKDKCPYCNAMKKILTKFSGMPAAQDKEINYYQLNREDCPATVKTLNVGRIPSLFIFKDGEKIAEKSGDITYRQLTKIVS